MMLTGSLSALPRFPAATEPWWVEAPALLASVEDRRLGPDACYQFGDGVLQVATEDSAVRAMFRELYGDCSVSARALPEQPRVRCTLHAFSAGAVGWADANCMLLTFLEGAPPDPAGTARCLLFPPPGTLRYTVFDSPVYGWRLIAGGEAPSRPILAADATHVLIDPQHVPMEFLADYLISVTLAAQPQLLPIHAASLCIGDAGVLLVGPTRSGKTTTAATLAARGHSLLGDEIALIRLATNEILPFRRAIRLRPGPRTAELSAALGPLDTCGDSDAASGGTEPLRVDELFPDSTGRPARLRAAVFLWGFGHHPTMTSVRPGLSDMRLSGVLGNEIANAAWGLAADRRTLKWLALRQVLAQLPSWRLELGPPSATARLIERTLEEL